MHTHIEGCVGSDECYCWGAVNGCGKRGVGFQQRVWFLGQGNRNVGYQQRVWFFLGCNNRDEGYQQRVWFFWGWGNRARLEGRMLEC